MFQVSFHFILLLVFLINGPWMTTWWVSEQTDMLTLSKTETVSTFRRNILSFVLSHLAVVHLVVEHVDPDDAVADHEQHRPREHHPGLAHTWPPHLAVTLSITCRENIAESPLLRARWCRGAPRHWGPGHPARVWSASCRFRWRRHRPGAPARRWTPGCLPEMSGSCNSVLSQL